MGSKKSKDFDTKKHGKNQKREATTGLLSGQELEPIPHPSGVGLAYKPKNSTDVALKRKEDDQYDFYLLENLPDKEALSQKYFLDPIKIVNESRKQEIANYLSLLFNVPHILEDATEEGVCLAEYQYDANKFKDVMRGIAKTAFNYLAYHNDTNVLLQSCFDPIREFIVNGAGQWSEFISIEKEPIVPDHNGHATDIHYNGPRKMDRKMGSNSRFVFVRRYNQMLCMAMGLSSASCLLNGVSILYI